MQAIPVNEWFCDECNLQTCASCKKNKIRLDSHVICGSEDGTKGCEGVFHLVRGLSLSLEVRRGVVVGLSGWWLLWIGCRDRSAHG